MGGGVSTGAVAAALLTAGLLASLLAAPVAAPAAAQGTGAAAQQRFIAERRDPGPEWIAVSNHFRHTARCESRGCVLMGPTEDREACEAWASAYNARDPYDHVRCLPADGYYQRRY